MKLERALEIVRAVVSEAPGPVSVFVADGHGELVAAATMDGAAPDTRLNAQRVRKVIDAAVGGGAAVFEDDARIGAVGVSGLAGEVDERLALGAIERTAGQH